MCVDIEDELKNDIDCEGFSLQSGESTDIIGVGQLCIYIRMVFNGMMDTTAVKKDHPLEWRSH